jgi:hypothetical protein
MIKLKDDVELIHEAIEKMASSFVTKIKRKNKLLQTFNKLSTTHAPTISNSIGLLNCVVRQ